MSDNWSLIAMVGPKHYLDFHLDAKSMNLMYRFGNPCYVVLEECDLD
jgi:hypothetical protein